MFLIKIYIKESYINYYHTIIQMCGQYCILAPYVFQEFSTKFDVALSCGEENLNGMSEKIETKFIFGIFLSNTCSY